MKIIKPQPKRNARSTREAIASKPPGTSPTEARRVAQRIRARTPPQKTRAADLIREDRSR